MPIRSQINICMLRCLTIKRNKRITHVLLHKLVMLFTDYRFIYSYMNVTIHAES